MSVLNQIHFTRDYPDVTVTNESKSITNITVDDMSSDNESDTPGSSMTSNSATTGSTAVLSKNARKKLAKQARQAALRQQQQQPQPEPEPEPEQKGKLKTAQCIA